jgi:molybdopterin-guanine dinucleotide biosynthesis protein A
VSGRLANVSAALLVGGAASRMGEDKAHLQLDGVALASRLAGLLCGLFEDVLLVGGDPPPEARGRRVADVPGPRCALRGAVSALEAGRQERLLLLATDLPLVSPDLLLALVAWPEADAVVARDARGRQPLCAVYRRAPALAVARERLAKERLALAGWLDALDVHELPDDVLASLDPDGSALSNLNTPEDLAAAERRLSAPG